MGKVEIREYTRLDGVTALARRVGCSVCHLSLVLRGQRPASRTLAARLRRMGYKVEAGPRAYAKGGRTGRSTAKALANGKRQ